MIKAFQDSIDRPRPEFATLDRLRAATVPKLSSFYHDNNRPTLTRPHSLNPIITTTTTNLTTTDKQPSSVPNFGDTRL